MKHALVVLTVVALMGLTAATALASHGAQLPTAIVPAHGSIWFGAGIDHFGFQTARLTPPAHGSIWFGSGLDRYQSTAILPAMPAHGSVWFGQGLS